MRKLFETPLEIAPSLFVRETTLDDIPFFMAYNVGSVRETFFPFETEEEVKEWLLECFDQASRGEKLEIVLYSQQYPFIGSIGVNNLNTIPEFGLWIREDLQGKGYGTKAVRAFSRILLGHEEVPYVNYRAEILNVASNTLAQKSGFKLVDVQDGTMLCYQIDRDVVKGWG